MAHLTVIYKTPKDLEAFDRHYFGTHVPLAKGLPGLRKYEVSRGPITAVLGPSDVYMIVTLHFDDMAAIRNAFASECGQAAAADRSIFAPDDTGVQMFIHDTAEV